MEKHHAIKDDTTYLIQVKQKQKGNPKKLQPDGVKNSKQAFDLTCSFKKTLVCVNWDFFLCPKYITNVIDDQIQSFVPKNSGLPLF